MKKIAIIGAGGWGTALAIILARSRAARRISLWAREADVLDSLRRERENRVFLRGCTLPEAIEVTGELGEALAGTDFVITAVPSAHTRAVYSALLPVLSPKLALVSATKGLEPETMLRASEVIEQVVAPKFSPRLAVLSGPSFASEAARGDPTAVVVASRDAALAAEVQHELSGPTFRLYTNDDVVGVELGGAIKNVIAIAAGVAEGLGLGHNAMAALITRGLAEMTRLGTALGARKETLAGLAGMGDLVLTCTGALSRNRTVGVELGRGRKIAEILGSMRMVAEGVETTAAARALAGRLQLEMPITEQMYAVLYQDRSPREAIRELMERRLKAE